MVLGIAALKAALKINSSDSFPNNCWVNGCNLGYAAFTAQLWSEAIYGYEKAINAIEKIRTWVTSESRRQKILEEALDIYQKMVQACINTGEIEKAFEYSERSRSKRLVDLMASYNLSQGEEIPPKVQELLQQYEELQQQIDQERQNHKSENNRSDTRAAWEAYNEAIASLETQKQQVWENLRREDPVLAGEIQVNPLSLSEIQKLFEGEQLAQMYNIPQEKRLIGSSQATSNNYRQLAQQVQVLHSCHHAQSRLDNPLESQLKLADGCITLGQLMTPSWRLPQLVEVFLSCCETNLGTPSLTDDILTLSTGFLCAGARSVVSTLWSVNDLATALFSIFYYQQRQEGKNRPKALQQAQIQLREFTKLDLKKIFQEVEVREKELIRNRKKYPSDSIEYEQWKREYNMCAKLNKRIIEIENSTQEFPFSDPRYWAAFICHGLR
ncbi:MAG: CHAT domain-containing protein [Nostoc sp.]|uniref:CHAT domain-containing protein n=1 Tax=Nostoc sp. TaxID=1180 RepID=UPI002FF8D721